MPYIEDFNELGVDDEQAFLMTEVGNWGEPEPTEASPLPQILRQRYHRSGRSVRVAPTPTPRPVSGISGATVSTQGGQQARINFGQPVAAKDSVDNLAKELRAQIKANENAVAELNRALDRNTSVLDKKIAALQEVLNKGQQQSQMATLLPLLLTKPPELEKISFAATTPTELAGKEVEITETKFKRTDSTPMLIALMAASGGLGGTGDSTSTLLLMLALGGGLGGSK